MKSKNVCFVLCQWLCHKNCIWCGYCWKTGSWRVKKKGCGRVRLWHKLGYSSDLLLEELREIMKNLFEGSLWPLSRLGTGAYCKQVTSVAYWFNFTLSAAVFLCHRLICYLTEFSNWRIDNRKSGWFLKDWIKYRNFFSCWKYLYLIVMKGNTIYLYQTKCCIGIWGSYGYDCKRDCPVGCDAV